MAADNPETSNTGVLADFPMMGHRGPGKVHRLEDETPRAGPPRECAEFLNRHANATYDQTAPASRTKFFAFLSKAELQAAWHQNTGYLPITRAAFDLTRTQRYYARNPVAELSIEQITLKTPTDNSRGLQLGSFILIRNAIEDELEQAFSGKKPAQAALKSAQARGNKLLRQFERANP